MEERATWRVTEHHVVAHSRDGRCCAFRKTCRGGNAAHPTFDVSAPLAVPGVSSEFLDLRKTRKELAIYEYKARELAMMFKAIFEENAIDALP